MRFRPGPDARPVRASPPAERLGLLANGNPTSKVVVGLGNHERQYGRTRHNVGAMAVAAAMQALGLTPSPGMSPIPATRSGFVLPSGYMNESGGPVRRAVERWRPRAPNLLVVHDDMDLPLGEVVEKEGGGHGGHNGLRDITAQLGTGAFRRLRIGIGRPPGRMDPADFVLAAFRPEEQPAVEAALQKAQDFVLRFLEERTEGAELTGA